MGWSSISPEVKTIIENPYEHMIINGDPEYMGKIVQMLCQISALFTHKGHIRAKYEYHRGDLVISVEDTGGGIDSEGLKNAFVRFARDGQQRICGTGLDLPIIKELAEKMGGTVEMQSELGKGTTVWLFFPCEVKNLEKKHEIIV
jgi:signal transduction histidine kinase